MKHVWTDYEVEYLKANYAENSTETLAEFLKLTVFKVYHKAFSLRLKKSESFLKSSLSGRLNLATAGVSSRYKPGNIPANKGKKLTAEQYAKAAPFMFKKGVMPHNTGKNGDISIRTDKRTGIKYKWIRLGPRKWDLLHRVVWKHNNGDINRTSIVTFKDGNQLNCDISNLTTISQEENMTNNTIQRYPEEVKRAIRGLTKLNKTIKENETDKH